MTSFGADTRGFTPVAGTSVLIGIVVLLLSVVGAATFGLIDGVAPPDAEFEAEQEDGELVVTAVGPDPVPAEELYVRGDDPDGEVAFGAWPDDGVVEPGERVTIPETTGNEDVEVVWEPVTFARAETLLSHSERDVDTDDWDEADPLGSEPPN